MNQLRGSVIVPTWNAKDVLARCLESIERQDLPGGFETIVVDDASTDGTAELLHRHADRVRVISNDRSVGFSAASNQAAREATGRILFFLNCDTELLTPDTLACLANAVEEPGVGIAGPMLLNPDGTLQPSCAGHPGIFRAMLVGSGLQRLLPDRILANVAPEFWSHDRSLDTDWVMGAALAVRRDVFHALGGFWPTTYGEDEDLAYRMQRNGMRVRFESAARVIHVGNHSNRQLWTDPERAARIANAELTFLRTHHARPRAAAIRAIVWAGYSLRLVVHGLLRQKSSAQVFRAMAKTYAGGVNGTSKLRFSPSIRPRVLFVITTYPDGGGISSILENFVAELDGPYEVHVAVVDERPGSRERLPLSDDRVHTLGYAEVMRPMLFPSSLVFAARVSRSLRRVVRATDPDAVIVQDALNLSVPGVAATRGLPTKLVLMDHGTLTNVYDPGWYPMIVRRFRPLRRPLFAAGFRLDAPWRSLRWRVGVRLADEVWMTGEELKPWFACARARSYTQSLPWGFAPPSAQERDEARARLGLPADATVLNLVSRLDGEKGLDTVLDALEDLNPIDPSVRFVVAGDGSLYDWMVSEVARRRLDSTVAMVGRLARDEVRRLQQASDFHVYAGTIGCGVSISLLEAMACSVIPIVSDVPRRQIALAGECGWVFPAGDRRRLRVALAEALATSDDERRRRRGATLAALGNQPDPGVPELLARLVEQSHTNERTAERLTKAG